MIVKWAQTGVCVFLNVCMSLCGCVAVGARGLSIWSLSPPRQEGHSQAIALLPLLANAGGGKAWPILDLLCVYLSLYLSVFGDL